MDYQRIVDNIGSTACILSVQKLPAGNCGEIRIVAGNRAYIDSIKLTLNDPNAEFVPDLPYENYIPKDLNFEDFSFRCAVLGKPMHAYVKAENYDFWMDCSWFPLNLTHDNIYYCCYIMEVSNQPDSELMATHSADVTSAVLNTCIKLHKSTDFDKTMLDVIVDIREICDAQRCSIILRDGVSHKCKMITEEGIFTDAGNVVAESMGRSLYEVTEAWSRDIAGSNCLIIKNHADMDILKERDPVWYDSLNQFGIKTLVLFSLRSNDETVGFIWASNFNTDDTVKIKETIELASFFIASVVSNHQLLDRLEIMSNMDMLTGVYNRNAMNERVDRFINGKDIYPKTLGIVFADLNGLKQMNDISGHAAGDRLLKSAASALNTIYPDCEIYRSGGDEFMILCPDISKEEFGKRIDTVKVFSEKNGDVSIAVGGVYVSEDMDIHRDMKLADKEMYIDKQKYYALNPDKKR